MELEQLRTFYFVAKHGTLPRAANYLKLTIPAISLRLKKLEQNLNAKLFYRHPNRLELTDKGRLFLQQVGHVFDAIDKLQEAIAPNLGLYSGKLTILMGRDLARFLLLKSRLSARTIQYCASPFYRGLRLKHYP